MLYTLTLRIFFWFWKYDAFISYVRREDRKRAYETVQILQAAGLRVFWDKDIPRGAPWEATIRRAIVNSKRVFVIWCCGAASSEYVMKEVDYAVAHNKPIVAHRVCPFPVPEKISILQWVDRIDPTHPCDCLEIPTSSSTHLINSIIDKELHLESWRARAPIQRALLGLMGTATKRRWRGVFRTMLLGAILLALAAARPFSVDLSEGTVLAFNLFVAAVGMIMIVYPVVSIEILRTKQRRVLRQIDFGETTGQDAADWPREAQFHYRSPQLALPSTVLALSILGAIQVTDREGWGALK